LIFNTSSWFGGGLGGSTKNESTTFGSTAMDLLKSDPDCFPVIGPDRFPVSGPDRFPVPEPDPFPEGCSCLTSSSNVSFHKNLYSLL